MIGLLVGSGLCSQDASSTPPRGGKRKSNLKKRG